MDVERFFEGPFDFVDPVTAKKNFAGNFRELLELAQAQFISALFEVHGPHPGPGTEGEFQYLLRTSYIVEIEFRNSTVADVLKFLQQQCPGVGDPKSKLQAGFVSTLNGATMAQRITLAFPVANLLDVYFQVAAAGGFDFTVEPNSISFSEGAASKSPASWESESASENLLVTINAGSAPPEEIARFLAELSRVYRKAGGSGINFRFEDASVREEELA